MDVARPVFLPWVLSGILGSWVLLVRHNGLVRLVVVVGRPWPTLSDLGRPRDGPAMGHMKGISRRTWPAIVR